ncbi:MAG: SsrA-binding protein SmpB [Rickettsiales bacterium]|jgi:SsrA-binding protein|nr:SsrA-binding protein SmpB [Rickettsiales bacterium]
MGIVAQNRKARYEYEILQEYEAGIVLVGTEIKSLKQGRANIQEGYISIDKSDEAWAYNLNIPPYNQSSKYLNHDPTRKRKLLLTKKEINKLLGSVKEKGLTIIPLVLYINDKGYAKIKIALAKGKKLYDKRESIKKKDIEREVRYLAKKGKV